MERYDPELARRVWQRVLRTQTPGPRQEQKKPVRQQSCPCRKRSTGR